MGSYVDMNWHTAAMDMNWHTAAVDMNWHTATTEHATAHMHSAAAVLPAHGAPRFDERLPAPRAPQH